MLSKVLILVSPNSSSLNFVRNNSASVLNFQMITPTGPSRASHLPMPPLCPSCRSMFSMRDLAVRYSGESGGSRAIARSQAARAPFQSPAWPASRACCESASNSCAWVSRPQDRHFNSSGSSVVPQFWHNVEVVEVTYFYCIGLLQLDHCRARPTFARRRRIELFDMRIGGQQLRNRLLQNAHPVSVNDAHTIHRSHGGAIQKLVHQVASLFGALADNVDLSIRNVPRGS